MTVLNLGPCERLIGELRQANFLTPTQTQQALASLTRLVQAQPDVDAADAARHLVDGGFLSAYQADALLEGRAADLVLREYILVDAVGEGVVGALYRGVCRTSGLPVDLEVLRQKSKWNTFAAFRQKKAFAEIQHPSVVPFTDVGTVNGQLYLVWPRTEGEPLSDVVSRSGPILAARALDYALPIAEGLQTCHERGVFHGLLHPASVLLTAGNKVMVRHFGIGGLLADQQAESLLNTRATAQAVDLGLEFASLETALDPKHRDALSDQYSFGAVLYYALTGRVPYPEQDPMKKIVQMGEGGIEPLRQLNPAVSERLAATVERMMRPQRADRFANMGEVVKALRGTLRSNEIVASPGPTAAAPAILKAPKAAASPPPVETPSRTPVFALVGLIGVVLAAAAAGLVWALR